MNNTDSAILTGLRILVADDDEYNLIIATDTLKLKADVTITTASNGKQVIALLNENDFDVILMDVQMPEMDGLEATRYIRSNFLAPKKDIPIVAITASVLISDLDSCTQAGMNLAIPKPYRVEELIRGIAQAIGKSSGAAPVTNHQDNLLTPNVHAASNLSYLQNFCEGNTTRIKKYISLFLESVPIVIEKISLALLQQDYREIANQVHGYKTTWIMMGMQEAKDLAGKIEEHCRQQTVPASINGDIEVLLQEIQRAESELKIASLQL